MLALPGAHEFAAWKKEENAIATMSDEAFLAASISQNVPKSVQ
jgi:hypothetical protein